MGRRELSEEELERKLRKEMGPQRLAALGIAPKPTLAPPLESVPPRRIPQPGIPERSTLKRPAPQKGGYYPTFNELDDRIIPELKLDTYEQSVLRRLYRLSRGFQSQTCTVGLTSIAKACAISRSRTQEAIASLLQRGLIQVTSEPTQDGTTYRVLPTIPAVPEKGIPPQNKSVPREAERGIPQSGTNKYNKDLINTDKKEDEKLMDAEEIKRILAEGE